MGPLSPLRLGGKARRRQRAERVAAALAGLREPVVVVLILIGFFTAISGKPLDGVLMLLVACGLAWDVRTRAGAQPRSPAPQSLAPQSLAPQSLAPKAIEGPPSPRTAPTSAASLPRRRRPAIVVCGLAGAALYAAVVGSFARYSWPATVAVAGLGAAVVAAGWRKPQETPAAGSSPRLWGVLLVAGGLWELSALLQQPDLTTESQAHPTISTLTDPLLASHGGRSTVLCVWLAIGWYLVRR